LTEERRKEQEMAELVPNKRPTREYRDLSETPWGFLDPLYARRSNRKYVAEDLSGKTAAELGELAKLALGLRDADPGSLVIVAEPDEADAAKRLVYKGIPNKINLWMARTPVSGFICLAVPASDVAAERPSELPHTVAAAEDCVLWLTERGLGTCWLAGVNSAALAGRLGLARGQTVPAAVVFGRPKPRAGGYDALTERTMSRKRKPLVSIAHEEVMGRPYSRSAAVKPFAASKAQDIGGLLESIGEGPPPGTRPPGEDLAAELCLEAARVAPNGGNMQKWEFVVVREPERLKKLGAASGGGAEDWRIAIVGAGYSKRLETALMDKPLWIIDLPIALSHVTLMASSVGLRPDLRIRSLDEAGVASLVETSKGARPVGVVGLCWPRGA